MLVLSRKENESIEFPELGIVVRVIGMKKSRVHLGIDAPPEISVMRSEKLDRPAKLASYLRPLECPSRKWDRELTRLESQFAALAELADSRDRSLAREVAADAIDRLAKLKRQTVERSRAAGQGGSSADFVAVRADVIDRLRGSESEDVPSHDEGATEPADARHCVRQSEAEYVVEERVPYRIRTCAVA